MQAKKIFFSLILFLLFLNFCSFPVESKKLPRLFFTKKMVISQKHLIKYKVKKGEWLYKILREQGIPERKIPHVVKIIKKINPHIKDLSNLKENDILLIPKIYVKSKNYSYLKKYKYKKSFYIVKKGDNVVKILRDKVGIPNNLIFNEYLTIFKTINPNIDPDKLEVGDKINLPIPLNLAKTLKTKSAIPVSLQPPKTKIKKVSVVKSDKKNLELILKELGFIITPGLKAYFPRTNGEWVYIDLKENILLNTPWGDKVLLTLKKNKSQNNNFPYTIIRLPSFKISQALDILALKNPKQIKIWKSQDNFIINNTDYSLEIKANKLVKINDNLYAIFILEDKIPSNINLVQSFLKKFNLKAIFLKKENKKITKINTNNFNSNYLYTPSVNSENIFSILGIKEKKLSTSISLDDLKNNNILTKEKISLNIFQQKNSYIKLYANVWKSSNNVCIIEENNPFISTFLLLNSYKVYLWL